MTQVQITLNDQILHQLFLGDSKESCINALLEAILNQAQMKQLSIKN
jgi:hypothetical protein